MKQCLFCGRPISGRARIWRFFWGPLWCGIPFVTYRPMSSLIMRECCSWSCCDAFVDWQVEVLNSREKSI